MSSKPPMPAVSTCMWCDKEVHLDEYLYSWPGGPARYFDPDVLDVDNDGLSCPEADGDPHEIPETPFIIHEALEAADVL